MSAAGDERMVCAVCDGELTVHRRYGRWVSVDCQRCGRQGLRAVRLVAAAGTEEEEGG